MNLGSFLEHLEAKWREWEKTKGWDIQPFVKSKIFYVGDDRKFYQENILALRKDIVDELRVRVPMPFRDVTQISVVDQDWADRKSYGPCWTADRIVEIPEDVKEILETTSPGLPSAMTRTIDGLKGEQKLLIMRYQYYEEERAGLPQCMSWMVGYQGIQGDDDMHMDIVLSRNVEESIAKDPSLKGYINNETGMILNEMAAISHPANYIVQVAPKLTPHETRRVAAGKQFPAQKRPHFIVVDHDVLVRMRAPQGGTHASPVPHERRGHWRRLAERCRHAKLIKGQKTWVRPALIGDPKWADNSAIYEVLPEFPRSNVNGQS